MDDHQQTSVPGLFAAGDVVKGLDQISHAMGEAGVAATTIRNLLARTATDPAVTLGATFAYRPRRRNAAVRSLDQ